MLRPQLSQVFSLFLLVLFSFVFNVQGAQGLGAVLVLQFISEGHF